MVDVVWRTSPWDHRVHAFRPDMIGEVTARALCAHCSRTSRLVDPYENDRKCPACLMFIPTPN